MTGIVDGNRPERGRITAEQFDRLFPYRCPICDKRLIFAPEVHLSVEHTWWARAKRRTGYLCRLLRATFVELFTTTIWIPWWAVAAVVALFGIAAAVGWWNR